MRRFQPKAFDWTTVPLEEAARNELLDDEGDALYPSSSLPTLALSYLIPPADYDLLQSAEDMLGKRTGAAQTQPLQPERIRMQRVLDANAAAPVSGAVTCTAFHPDSSMIAVGGSDKSLRLFATDGQHNALLLGVRFKDLAVRSAGFLKHRTEMLVSGRKPYFYVLDTATGQLAKMPGPGSGQTNLQHLAVSPEGSRFAVIGRGGHVHVGDGASKLWVEQLAMNGQASSVCFLSDHLLASSTKEAGVYLWDLRHSRRPLVGKWTHDDGSATCSLSAYCPSPSYANTHSNKFALDSAYLSVGTASGVLSVFQGVDEGVVRGRGGAAGGAEGNYYPLTAAVEEVGAGMRQVRTVMNLTTQISCSAFHPSGQLLAMASYESKDALKLVHLPSYSVYSNWPQRLTPLHTVETLAFSPDGGCLAVGNKRGKVLLFQLPHFMDGAARRGLRDKRRLN